MQSNDDDTNDHLAAQAHDTVCRDPSKSSNRNGNLQNGSKGRSAQDRVDAASKSLLSLRTPFKSEHLDITSVYDFQAYIADGRLSNQEFLKKLNTEELQIIKEMHEWCKKYGILAKDMRYAADQLLSDGIDLDGEGLTFEQKETVTSLLEELRKLPLEELLARVMICDVT